MQKKGSARLTTAAAPAATLMGSRGHGEAGELVAALPFRSLFPAVASSSEDAKLAVDVLSLAFCVEVGRLSGFMDDVASTAFNVENPSVTAGVRELVAALPVPSDFPTMASSSEGAKLAVDVLGPDFCVEVGRLFGSMNDVASTAFDVDNPSVAGGVWELVAALPVSSDFPTMASSSEDAKRAVDVLGPDFCVEVGRLSGSMDDVVSTSFDWDNPSVAGKVGELVAALLVCSPFPPVASSSEDAKLVVDVLGPAFCVEVGRLSGSMDDVASTAFDVDNPSVTGGVGELVAAPPVYSPFPAAASSSEDAKPAVDVLGPAFCVEVVYKVVVVVAASLENPCERALASSGRADCTEKGSVDDATVVVVTVVRILVVELATEEVVMVLEVLVVVNIKVAAVWVGGSKFASGSCTGRSRNSGHWACTTPMRARGMSKMISLWIIQEAPSTVSADLPSSSKE